MSPDRQPQWDPERHARRLVPLGGLLAVGGLYAGGFPGFAALAVGLLLLLAAAYSARDGLLLLGPFARYELARSARLGRRQWWRVFYTVAFALMLFLTLLAYAPESVWDSRLSHGRVKSRLQAANTAFFIWYAVCLIGYVAVLAVTQFTSLVAEERAGKRWDVLLTTDLRPQEILFGKAAGRVPQLLDPILASLPVLTIATLFGGVSPTMVLLVAASALALSIGIAGVAAFYSVFSPTVTVAMTNTVGMGIMYAVVSGIAGAAAISAKLPPPVTVGLAALGTGNPIVNVGYEKRTGPSGEPLEATLARSARKFAAFHLGAGLLFGFIAGRRLRTSEPWGVKKAVTVQRALGERPVPPDRAGESALRKRHVGIVAKRPPVSDYPIAWWEQYGPNSPAQAGAVLLLNQPRAILRMGGLVLLFLGTFRLATLSAFFGGERAEFILSASLLLAVGVISLVMVLGPLFRATRSVVRERVGDTLEALRTLPLDPRDVVFQKWLGCVQSVLPLGAVVLVILVPAVLTGFVSVMSLLGWAVSVPIYVMVAAAYGLVFSVRAKTPARATFTMIVATIVLIYAGSFLTMAFADAYTGLPSDMPRERYRFREHFLMAQFPPAAVGAILAGPKAEVKPEAIRHFLAGLAVSLSLFTLLGYAAYQIAVYQFSNDDAKAREGK